MNTIQQNIVNIGYAEIIEKLIWRPIIRDDQICEWMNKMTDDELIFYNNDLDEYVKQLPIGSYEPTLIDYDIIYRLYMLGKPRLERIKKLESL